MLAKPKEKIERRIGERLFLKGERGTSPKSAMNRRPYPPGMHGKRTRRSRSEFGLQLREKQKVRHTYGLDDKDLKRYFIAASRNRSKPTDQAISEFLESRLDNAVYRLGFAVSRGAARHLVSYGHIGVNNRKVKQSSYCIRAGDRISFIRPQESAETEILKKRLEKHAPPEWLDLDAKKGIGTVRRMPQANDLAEQQNMSLVIEYYSR